MANQERLHLAPPCLPVSCSVKDMKSVNSADRWYQRAFKEGRFAAQEFQALVWPDSTICDSLTEIDMAGASGLEPLAATSS